MAVIQRSKCQNVTKFGEPGDFAPNLVTWGLSLFIGMGGGYDFGGGS